MATLQAIVTVTFAVWVCGLEVEGPVWQLGLVAVIDAILGTALGLLASAFARTEFQAVQFMPLIVFPQILLGGLFMPRDEMPEALYVISQLPAAELRDRRDQRRHRRRRGVGRLRTAPRRRRVRCVGALDPRVADAAAAHAVDAAATPVGTSGLAAACAASR